MTLGVKPRARPADHAVGDQFRQLDHFDGAGPVGQAADEAALLERRDQAMDAGLGAQIERVLHLVEGRRHAGLLQPLMDKAQQLGLLASQHRRSPSQARRSGNVLGRTTPLAETNHERTLSVPYVFRNHLI